MTENVPDVGHVGAEPPGDVDEAEIGNDCPSVFEEDVLGLEIVVDNALLVEVAHPVRNLLRDDHQLVHRELVLAQVQVRVQRVA